MRLIYSRLSFLAVAGVLAFTAVGGPASGATPVLSLYSWPITVNQPLAINIPPNSFVSVTCNVTAAGSTTTIGTSGAQKFPYAQSTSAGGSVTAGLTIKPVGSPALNPGAVVTCTATVLNSSPLAAGTATSTLPTIVTVLGKASTPKPPTVNMPNITIKK
jgi:hypothetical protein